MLSLKILINDQEQIFESPKNSVTIGRHNSCDVQLDEAIVSSRHLKIFKEGELYKVEDLGSTNGTFVNGQRIKPHNPVSIDAGVQFKIGPHNILVSIEASQKEDSILSFLSSDPPSQVPPSLVDPLEEEEESSLNEQSVLSEVSEFKPKASGRSTAPAGQNGIMSAFKGAIDMAAREVIISMPAFTSEGKASQKSELILKHAEKRAKEIIQSAKAESDKALSNYEALREKSEKLKKINDQLESKKTDLDRQIEKLTSQISENQQALDSNQQRLADLEKLELKIEMKSEELEKIQAKEQVSNDNLVALKDQVFELENKISSLEKLQEDIQQKIDLKESLHGEVAELNSESDRLSLRITELKNEELKLSLLTKHLDDQVKDKQLLSSEVTLLESQKANLALDVETANLNLIQLKDEIKVCLSQKESLEDLKKQIIADRAAADVYVRESKESAEKYALETQEKMVSEEQMRISILRENSEKEIANLIEAAKSKAAHIESEAHLKIENQIKLLTIELEAKYQAKLSEADALIEKADLKAKMKIELADEEGVKKVLKATQEAESIKQTVLSQVHKDLGVLESRKQEITTELAQMESTLAHDFEAKKKQYLILEQELRQGLQETQNNLNQLQAKAKEAVDEEAKRAKMQLDVELASMRLKSQKDTELEIEQIKRKSQESLKQNSLRYAVAISQGIKLSFHNEVKAAEKTSPDFLEQVQKMIGKVLSEENLDSDDSHLRALFQLNSKDADRSVRYWKKMAVTSVLVVVLGSVGFNYFESAKEQMKSMVKVNGPSASEKFVAQVLQKRADKPKFNPEKVDTYKPSYTERVLYTRNYVEVELNSEYREKWILSLNKFFVDDLKLSENSIIVFIAKESTLIKRLDDEMAKINPEFEKEGIARMKADEDSFVKEVREVLKTKSKYNAFKEFKQQFYEQYTKEADRQLSSDVSN